MNLRFKCFFIFSVFVLWPAFLIAQIKDVKVDIKQYESGNNFHKSIRIKITNQSGEIKNGKIEVKSNNLDILYEVKLLPSETKIYEIPFKAYHDASQVFVKFGRENESLYINEGDQKSFNKGVLEIKTPSRGQLLFKHGDFETLEEKTFLGRIDLHDLPNNALCLLQYQLIVIPSEMELSLSAEQFQTLKTYVGFGGRIMLLDSSGKLPTRWKNISNNCFGDVFVESKFKDQLDFKGKLREKVDHDLVSAIFMERFSFDNHQSPKGVYLFIVLLFIICIGPINFYFLHKKNKKFLIFITSPLLAILFSVLLIIVFFVKEGFYKRYEGNSITLIDAQNNQALLVNRNSVYYSTISGELERDRNGIYFPVNTGDYYGYRDSEFKNTVGSKALLSGNFAKARSLNEFGEIKQFECHSKVVLRKELSKLHAKNGFATNQTILVYDCILGNLYTSNAAVEPDQEVPLTLLTSHHELTKSRNFYTDIFPKIITLAKERDSGYIYIAFADTNEFVPFREKEGFIQGQNEHIIIGVIHQ